MIGVYLFILLTLLHNTTSSLIGVLIPAREESQARSFQCMIQSGYNLLTQVISSDIDSIQPVNIDILYKAKTMFKAVDYIYSSCRGRDPVQQVKELANMIPSQLWSTVWIFLQQEQGDDQCNAAKYSKKDNCEYLKQMLQQFQKNEIKAGILTNGEFWEKIAGNQCDQVGSYPLYWFTADEYPFFSNFVAFGGWKYPQIKMYTGTKVCGIEVGLTYRKQLNIRSSD